MNSDLVLWGRRIIEKEAKALVQLEKFIGSEFAAICEILSKIRGTILLSGMGKSGLVARKWASTLAATGSRAYFINPAEAAHGDLGILRDEDALILLSFSGETEELTSLLRHAKENCLVTIAVTGNAKSSLAQNATHTLSFEVSEDACPFGIVPTTSSTVMTALGDAVAITLMQMRGFTEKDFAKFHPGGSLGRRYSLQVGELMHRGTEIPVVSPHESFKQTLLEMTCKRLGLAVVIAQGKVVGVITDGDLRRAFQSKVDVSTMTASELMTQEPKSIEKDSLAFQARELMEKHSIQHLLVYDAGNLVGVIHFQDLLRAKVL